MVLGSPVSSDAPLESRSDAATQTTTTHSDPSGRDGPFDSSSGSDGAAAGMMNEDFALTGVESGRLPASASTESRAVVPASSGGDPPFDDAGVVAEDIVGATPRSLASGGGLEDGSPTTGRSSLPEDESSGGDPDPSQRTAMPFSMSRAEAQARLDEFMQQYPRVAALHATWKLAHRVRRGGRRGGLECLG